MHVRSSRVGLRTVLTFVAVAALVVPLPARTPQQLVADFAGILPVGMKARLAWVHDGSVYVVDSDSGIVRDLTPASIFTGGTRSVSNPSITHDGSRVVFQDLNTYAMYVINWNGTGLRSFLNQGYMSRYWRDRVNNTDWVTYDQYGIKRVNVDNPSQIVSLWSKTGTTWPWFTLSQDGTHLALLCPHPNIGIGVVPNGKLVTADSTGCKPNIAPDNSYHVIFQTPYHKVIRMCDSNGVKIQDIAPNDAIIAWATANGKMTTGLREHNWLRWTNNRDYITFQMNCTNVNPFIMRLSDRKWMYIEDNATDAVDGTMDMVVFSQGPPSDVRPTIVAMNDASCQLNRQTQFVAWVTGTPLPTLSAAGLPPGMVVVNGTTPAQSFALAGTPTQAGVFTTVLTTTNRAGEARDTLTITVKTTNDPPTVNAGADGGVRVGTSYTLFGLAKDDGIPNAALQIAWKQVGGPRDSAFLSNTATVSTEVGFIAVGVYAFELRASDGEYTVADTVSIVVGQAIPFMVIRPSPGDRVRTGAAYTVSWQVDTASSVLLELSTDDGLTYTDLPGLPIAAGTTSWTWQVPSTMPESDSCFIRVTKYFDRSKVALSGLFHLVREPLTLEKTERPVRGPASLRGPGIEIYSIDGRRLGVPTPGSRTFSAVCRIAVRRDKGGRRVLWKTIEEVR